MGSRPWLVAESFSKLPSALNTRESRHSARRGGVGQARGRAECAGQLR
jgi:hypothetical protein